MRNVLLVLGVLAFVTSASAQDLRLVQAAKAAEQAQVIALLKGGADPNVPAADGTTALHWAVRNNDAAIATTIERDRMFFPAEAYHQDYMVRHPRDPYILMHDLPKVADLKRLFPDRYRSEPILVGTN